MLGEASELDQRISKCVDAALKKLGENAKQSLYYHLERDFKLERLEIPKKPEVFEKALTTILGEQKAKTIEELILAEITNAFQLKMASTLTFKEAVAAIRNSCLRKFI